VTRGQLRPVVTANDFRSAALVDDLFQHPRDSSAGETGVYFQRQALARIRIHDGKHAVVRPHSTASCIKSNAHS